MAEAGTARVEMVGVSKTFPGVRALENVDLRLLGGEVHALMGENGAGKSTLIKVMTGALRRDEGEIRLDGQSVEIDTPGQARALGIGTVYQEVNLVPTMSVTKNLTLGRQPTKFGLISWRAAREVAKQRLQATQHRHRRRAAARLLLGRHPAAYRHRARARRRHARAGARRADRQPRRQRDGAAVSDRARS